MQEGKTSKESKAKAFKEGLYVKGQQIKESEIIKKLTKQNEKELQAKRFKEAREWANENDKYQEDDERDL